MQRINHLAILFLLVAFICVACAPKTEFSAKAAIVTAVSQFHEQYNSKNFIGIYGTSVPLYKRQTDLRTHEQALAARYMTRGKVLRTTLLEWQEQAARDGVVVTAAFRTTSEFGEYTEYFAFKFNGRSTQGHLMIYK